MTGDHYAGDWPKDRFRAHGIHYELADRSKSEFYAAFLPLVNGQRVELLDHQRMNAQLLALERSTSRLGKDSISHPPGGHDDLINAVAGAAVQAAAHAARPGFVSVEAFTKSYTAPTRVTNDQTHQCFHCGTPRCRLYGREATAVLRTNYDGPNAGAVHPHERRGDGL